MDGGAVLQGLAVVLGVLLCPVVPVPLSGWLEKAETLVPGGRKSVIKWWAGPRSRQGLWGRILPGLILACGGCWQFLMFCDLQRSHFSLCICLPTAFPLCVSVLMPTFPSSCKDTSNLI